MDATRTASYPTEAPHRVAAARDQGILNYGLRKYPGPFRRPWRIWLDVLGDGTMLILGVVVIVAVMWVSIAVQRAEEDRARGISRGVPRRGAAIIAFPPAAFRPVFVQRVEDEFDRATSGGSATPLPQAVEDAQRVLKPLQARGLVANFSLENSVVVAVAGQRFEKATGDEKHLCLGALSNWGQAKSSQVRIVTVLDAPGGRVVARSEPAGRRR